MDEGRSFPFSLFFWSIVLVAVDAGSIYLANQFVVKPQRALQNQMLEQKATIVRLEQDKQRLETYLKLLKHLLNGERMSRCSVRDLIRRVPYSRPSGSSGSTPRSAHVRSRIAQLIKELYVLI